jgi:hypothetical protein
MPTTPTPTKSPSYTVLLHQQTRQVFENYLNALKSSTDITRLMGTELQSVLKGKVINRLTVEDLIDALLQTKKPCIFAEDEILKQNEKKVRRWNTTEITLLGNINIAAKVTFFDNMSYPNISTPPTPPRFCQLFFYPAIILKKIGE